MSLVLERWTAWPPLRRSAEPAVGTRTRAAADAPDAALEPVLVQLVRMHPTPRRIGVTAVEGGAGATTVAVALARIHARRGHAATLLDAAWRAPAVAAAFGLEGRPGLADVVLGEVAPREGAHAVADHLTVVPAGRRAAVASAHLDDPNAEAFLGLVEARSDLVVLDCPPLRGPGEALADTAALARLVDGFVVVIGAERTRRAVVERALADLEAAGGRVLGVVLNGVRRPIPASLYRWLG